MRQKLTITDVLEPRTIGDKNIPLQEFNANGKKYSVFSKALFPYIKLNTEIDAEVEVKEGENWTNYKVIDIFVNGQSVKAQGQGGGYRGKSPEELDLSRRSYALSYAKDLAVAGKIEVKDIPGKATEFSDWLQVKTTAVAVKETEKAIGVATPTPSPVKGEETKSELATQKQKDDLAKFDKGRIAEIMKERGFPKKLTKLNADILIDQLTVEDATKDLPEIDEGLPFG